MKQTEKYSMNLIESSDPFLPDSLNENTRIIESVISAFADSETAARQEALAELATRVTQLEKFHFAYGRYIASAMENGASTDVTLGFAPKAVLVVTSFSSIMAVKGYNCSDLALTSTGFRATYTSYNSAGIGGCYLAFG